MVTKRQLREEVIKLNYRIADLEERLCPCEEHDWKEIDSHIANLVDSYDTDTIYTYKCRRCGKIKEVVD